MILKSICNKDMSLEREWNINRLFINVRGSLKLAKYAANFVCFNLQKYDYKATYVPCTVSVL